MNNPNEGEGEVGFALLFLSFGNALQFLLCFLEVYRAVLLLTVYMSGFENWTKN
jgi:hypothetical protein